MAANDDKTGAVGTDRDDLAALAREMLAETAPEGGGAAIPAAEPGADLVTLRLSELIRGEQGEVVLFNDSGLRVMALETDFGIVAQGAAEPHASASGEDVSGFRYVAFDNGLTLFYQDGLDLIVRSEQG
jgi:hypothetical protein